jgi:hypothetical protein
MYKVDLYEISSHGTVSHDNNGSIAKKDVQNNRRAPILWGTGQQVTRK